MKKILEPDPNNNLLMERSKNVADFFRIQGEILEQAAKDQGLDIYLYNNVAFKNNNGVKVFKSGEGKNILNLYYVGNNRFFILREKQKPKEEDIGVSKKRESAFVSGIKEEVEADGLSHINSDFNKKQKIK